MIPPRILPGRLEGVRSQLPRDVIPMGADRTDEADSSNSVGSGEPFMIK